MENDLEERERKRKTAIHLLTVSIMTIAVFSCTVGVIGYSMILNVLTALGAK